VQLLAGSDRSLYNVDCSVAGGGDRRSVARRSQAS